MLAYNYRPDIDVGLYPLLDTDFNRYRSINKLIEYVHHGAAPLVADVPAMSEVPAELRVGQYQWPSRIGELVRDSKARRQCWQIAADFVQGRDPLSKAAALWDRLLAG